MSAREGGQPPSGVKRRRGRVALPPSQDLEGESVMESRRGDGDSEGSGEDLFGDNYADDYKEGGLLDAYDSQMLDERDYGEDRDARFAAEAALQDRDRREGRGRLGRLGAALESDEGAFTLLL